MQPLFLYTFVKSGVFATYNSHVRFFYVLFFLQSSNVGTAAENNGCNHRILVYTIVLNYILATLRAQLAHLYKTQKRPLIKNRLIFALNSVLNIILKCHSFRLVCPMFFPCLIEFFHLLLTGLYKFFYSMDIFLHRLLSIWFFCMVFFAVRYLNCAYNNKPYH